MAKNNLVKLRGSYRRLTPHVGLTYVHVERTTRETSQDSPSGLAVAYHGPTLSAIFTRPDSGRETHHLNCAGCGAQITTHLLNTSEARKRRRLGYLAGAAMLIAGIALIPIMTGIDSFPAALFVLCIALFVGGYLVIFRMLTYPGLSIEDVTPPHKVQIDEYRPI